jgi:predicted CXXCH cytochrome family protein
MSLPCQTCHTPSPSGEALRIPQAQVCMQCHQTVAADRPAIQKLASYAQSNSPIPWVRIYELQSFVTFSHKTHLDHGATCEQCHGAVSTRDRLSKESDLSMKWCVDCHTAKRASIDCNACHTLEQ